MTPLLWAGLAVAVVFAAWWLWQRHRARIRRAKDDAARRANPYQCVRCRNASWRATGDPDGLCDWCRAEEVTP